MADLFGVRVTGPLQAHARGFSEQLTELGYTQLSAADQLRLMAHLSRWLASRGLGAWQLTPRRAEQFLCARRRAGHASRRSQRGLTPLLGYLRGQGVTPQPGFEPLAARGPRRQPPAGPLVMPRTGYTQHPAADRARDLVSGQ